MRRVLMLATLMMLACAQVSLPGGESDTLTYSERNVQAVVESALQNTDELRLTDVAVDLREGEMHISGNLERSPGQAIPAELTVTLAAQNGQISATATQATVAGVALSQSSVDRFNVAFGQGMTASALENQNNQEITGVTITDGSLQITLASAAR